MHMHTHTHIHAVCWQESALNCTHSAAAVLVCVSRIITAMSVINANNDRIDWPITAADYAQRCSWSADRLTDAAKCHAQPPRHQCVVVIHASLAFKMAIRRMRSLWCERAALGICGQCVDSLRLMNSFFMIFPKLMTRHLMLYLFY